MTDRLFFEVEGVAHEIALTRDYAPRTVDKILACLPLEVTIHCAKIAGNHIMWPMPFLQRLETAADVLDAPPGAFLFWPDRQYLEIVYAPLQAETAAINLLGEMTDGVDWLADYADRQRRLHGHKTFTARMYVDSWRVPAPPALPKGEDAWSRLRAARLAAWAGEPECVDEVMGRRGLNIPFGPLAIVEGELRRTHELLWRLWNDETRYQAADKAMIARATLELAAARIAGFCHLPEIGARFEDGIACLGGDDGPDVQAVLEELVLYAGRMAAWFDLRICWHPMNELTLGVLESEAAGGSVRG